MAVVSTGQITITDVNDYTYQGTTAPKSPIPNVTVWIDTSVTPSVMKRWTGTAWEIVNDVQVGGENLILGTKELVGTNSSYKTTERYDGLLVAKSYNDGTGYRDTITAESKVLNGTKFVLSFYAKSDKTVNVECFFYNPNSAVRTETSTGQIATSVVDGRAQVTLIGDNTWRRYWVKISSATTITTKKSIIVCRNLNTTVMATVYACGVKLEAGNIPTDWTPAPEDVEALINQEIQDVENKITGLETTVNTTFKDGIIEQAEAKAIEKYINTLNAEKSDIDNQYNTIYNDALLTGTAKDNLYSQKESYNTAHLQLLSSINTAVADGKTTPSEKSDVDSKFTNYKNVLGGLAIRLTEALKAIEAKRIDNLQIGGRNLMLNSKGDFIGFVKKSTNIFLKAGDVITVSAKGKLKGNVKLYHGNNGWDYMPVLLFPENDFTEKSVSITVPEKDGAGVNMGTYPITAYINFLDGADSNSVVKNIKVERGNKATDWTPAPEDVDSAILTAQTSANTANSLLADIANDNILTPSEKQSTKKEWDIIVGENSVVESQANSLGVSTTSYVNAYNSLNSYVSPLLADLTVNSAIVGSDFRANFKNYYDAKIALLKAVTDKLKSNTDNLQTQLDSESAKVINLENKTNFLTGTTIEGNAVATGTLLVGNSEGTNAGITGIIDRGSASVRLWAGATFAGKNTAKWLMRDDGVEEQWFNGILVRQRGVINGSYVETWYNLNGQIGKKITFSTDGKILEEWYNNGTLVYQIGQNGIYYVSEIPESFTFYKLINLNSNIDTYDYSFFDDTVRSRMWQKTSNPQIFELRGNIDSWQYNAGQNVYSESNKIYEGVKATQSKTNNITDGWYAYQQLGDMMSDGIDSTKKLVFLIKTQSGKIIQSVSNYVETQGYDFNQF